MRAGAAALARRETGRQHRAGQLLALRDADAVVVEHGAAALAGGEQLVAVRVVDHGLGQLATLHERDGDAVLREIVQKVGCAIKRIDDPDILSILIGITTLLTQKTVGWISVSQSIDNRTFGGMIHFTDKVVIRLAANLQSAYILRCMGNNSASTARGFNRDGQHRMHRLLSASVSSQLHARRY